MNNEEPINLSHYPDGRKPEENESKPAPIERDDFPGKNLLTSDIIILHYTLNGK